MAQFKGVSVDTVMDIVARGPFQRLGLDALLTGPATATWINGDVKTLAVGATLQVSPGASVNGREVPTTGTIDGVYTQRNGAVDVHALDLVLPASRIEAHGQLGAYPVSSPSALSVEFHSHDLSEFDPVLRDLGLQRNGKAGAAALPVSLGGHADFSGMWNGSLSDPHLNGALQATNVSIELPPGANDKSGKPQLIHWDTIDATGAYSAARISVDHGSLTHGQATIALSGSLNATPSVSRRSVTPNYDLDSDLRLHVKADHVGVDELSSFLGTPCCP